ncbi:MAG TPA: DUF167 domain-containing protein [Candidatus Limnocylindria bacterium]|jgi:uncharacterized protein (TIGR00251 family)|nr:DUF167 domain-containing protein [Candidatus Limnocylindria bacterium]
MNPPAYLRTQGDEVHLAIKVQPRASRNEIVGMLGTELKIKTTAPPVDSAANEAVMAFLVERLGCGRRDVSLLRGQTSQHKMIAIRGMSLDTIAKRLDVTAA